jgi:ribosomal-protein-alanine N-acetyltransferase
VGPLRIGTRHLELLPLPAEAAAALPDDPSTASRQIGALIPEAWPQVDLLDVLPMQAAAANLEAERFGVWVLIERETNTVVGDIGFFGPPQGRSVEIGFSVIPDRRRRGYASEAARALVEWALRQPGITEVTARSDAENEASARVLTRAAFDRLGLTGGTVRWRRRTPGR